MNQHINYYYPVDKIKHFYGYGYSSKMLAKYFKFEESYLQTPFLKSFKIISKSDIQNAFFEVTLYTPNNLGIPTYVLNNKPIRCNVVKDICENIIDIRHHQIRFPEQGLFVVIGFINIDSNISNFTYHKGNNKEERFNGSIVNPTIGSYPSEYSDSFLLGKNGWIEVQKNESIFKDYINNYHNLAIGLELSK